MNLLLWFRNDLRTDDNPALHHFLNSPCLSKRCRAIFFISEEQWQQHDWSPIKIDFIKRHAHALVEELIQYNIQLEIIYAPDFKAQVTYLTQYCNDNDIDNVIANSELEFNEQQRDMSCVQAGIKLSLFESDVIVPKGRILNKSDTMYKVFTPFKRAWLKYIRENGFEYIQNPSPNLNPEAINERTEEKKPGECNSIKSSVSSRWPLADTFKQQALPYFYQDKLAKYHESRDIPSIKGTSGISPYLAAGLISPRYVLMTLLSRSPDLLLAIDSEEFSWLNEIIWRDFYRHLMFHEQRLSKHHCFNDKYQEVIWPNNQLLFNAWCEGKTGYPLVDAAMIQLKTTGWMHNRLRMVVASFLTKHLLIDWRLGEKYFMQHLIDGDLASNNGGWQWAASTGCDAQPYFRIFNPIRQSERFDPNGTFIRKYIPELANVPDKKIHFPHQYINDNTLSIYWPAIVEHKEARLRALAFYK
jgi:deoxyribodipyrimidine photo-lyase